MQSRSPWRLLLLSLSSLAVGSPAGAKPAVVATTSVICDVVEQIAEATLDLTCLLEPGQDPHTYELTPRDRAAIDDADLVLYGGYNFAPDIVEAIEASSSSAPKVAIYELAVPNPLMGTAHDEHHGEHHDGDEHHDADEHHGAAEHHDGDEHHDEHHDGDEHQASSNGDELVADPHVWHSAIHGVGIVDAISEQLIGIAPDNRERFSTNADVLVEELTELNGWIEMQVATVPTGDRKLITTHDSFGYFADAYGFEVAGALSGLSSEERPSAGRLAKLVDWIEESGVPAIFAETTTNRDLIETVARNAGVLVPGQPLYVEGPGGPNTPAPNYQQMLVVNTCTIVKGLGGNCLLSTSPLVKR